MRGRWLVLASLILAVLTEVFPTEVDVLVVAVRSRDLSPFLITKTICLSLILTPLAVYLWMNGKRGMKAAKGRVIAIGTIVVLRLALDTTALVSYFLH